MPLDDSKKLQCWWSVNVNTVCVWLNRWHKLELKYGKVEQKTQLIHKNFSLQMHEVGITKHSALGLVVAFTLFLCLPLINIWIKKWFLLPSAGDCKSDHRFMLWTSQKSRNMQIRNWGCLSRPQRDYWEITNLYFRPKDQPGSRKRAFWEEKLVFDTFLSLPRLSF